MDGLKDVRLTLEHARLSLGLDTRRRLDEAMATSTNRGTVRERLADVADALAHGGPGLRIQTDPAVYLLLALEQLLEVVDACEDRIRTPQGGQ